MSETKHFDAEGNLTGTSVTTTPSRWDEESRIWELAWTDYLDSLCECGVPRSVCMDNTKAWFVDHRIGYRCQAMQTAQRAKEKEDAATEKAGGHAFPMARKWFATEYREGMLANGEDSPG